MAASSTPPRRGVSAPSTAATVARTTATNISTRTPVRGVPSRVLTIILTPLRRGSGSSGGSAAATVSSKGAVEAPSTSTDVLVVVFQGHEDERLPRAHLLRHRPRDRLHPE